MATHGPPSVEQAPTTDPTATNTKLVEYEEFIENQLRKTRSHVRGVDVAAGLMILVAGTMGYFFLAALVDHWLIAGGLAYWGRFLLWGVYLAAATYWVATEIVPLLVKRINPLYAAETIERSRPTLKNTLLNFLLFRANPAGVHEKVFQAIEEQAATKLAGVQVDSAVDRTRLIRLGCVLIGILIVCAAYMLLSPKDLFQTVRRVAMPWADISAPTRTTIDEITPGDAHAFRGQQVEVKARVAGLPTDGKVMLYYTTADRQIVDRPVELNLPANEYQHVAVLPAPDAALEQTIAYRIEAGDAVTRPYSIEVVAAPTIVVRAIDYKYPEYTGLLAQRVEHQGDIKAIEGTQVTLEALANQDIDSAHVDFDCNDTLDLRMRADKQTARATFGLSLGDDRRTPEHSSYQVLFKNATGQQNPQPVRHEISVTRDIAPEIQFVAPRKDEIDLPADAAVELEVVANDPDFALARVKLSAAKGQSQVVDETLLDETWRGQFVKKFRFQPRKLGLVAGDLVDYWAVAVDNKDPGPNQTETSRRRIRIVSPSGREGDRDQLAQNKKRGEGERQEQPDDTQKGDDKRPRDQQQQPDDKSDVPKADPDRQPSGNSEPGEDQPEKTERANDAEQGESQDGSSGAAAERRAGEGPPGKSDEKQGEKGAEPGVPSDGTNDGEAIERILEHRGGQDQGKSDKHEKEPAGDEQGADNREKGSQNGQSQDAAKSQQADKDAERDQRQPPDDAPGAKPREGSGANQTGAGKPSDDKQQDGRNQQQRGDDRQEQGQQSQGGNEPTEKPDNKDPGQPGDSTPPDGNAQGDTSSQEKPQHGKGARQSQPAGTKDRQSSGEDGQGETGQQPSDGSKTPDQPNVEHRRGEGTDSRGAERQGDGQPNKQDRHRQATQDSNTREDGTPQDPSTKGQGAGAGDDPERHPDQKPPQDTDQRPDARGGDGENQKGQSGAGQRTDDNKGSPTSQPARPTRKSNPAGPDDKEQTPQGDAQSPNTSERESDTESAQDGEQSGGGKRGGGQKANKSGTGGAGQNTAADDGAGRSDDAGDGETSNRAGGDRQADRETGQSGSKTGPGSRTKSSDGENEQSGGQNAPQQPSDSSSAQPPSGQNPEGAGAQGGQNPSATRPGSSTPREQKWKPGVDKADEANLEYARKATGLALEHLKDQLKKEQPDHQLLDRLGWSRKDLENFVKRWDAMRKDAEAPGDQGAGLRRELDETLRSLGLRPRATTLKSNQRRDDRSQGYQESPHTTPPPEYTESFKAYTQGTARGGK
ncbi:MAG: hypothetical protein WD063_08830 [Pirellulales bacterium]